MKKSLQLVVFAILLIISTAIADDKVKIGLSAALTGAAATTGVEIKNALLFANKEIAKDKYEVLAYSDACDGMDSAAVASRLIGIDKVKYVFGHCNATVKLMLPDYENAGVVVFAPVATAVDVPDGFGNIFRTAPSDERSTAVLLEHIKSHYKHVGVLTEESDYTKSLTKAFLRNNSGGVLKIDAESYSAENVDLRPILSKFKEKKIEALFLNSNSEGSFAAALKQIKELKYDWQIYAAYLPARPTVRKLVSDSEAEGVIFAEFPSFDDVLTAEGKELLKKFQSQYGKLKGPDIIFTATFEALRALDQAISSGGDVKAYLKSHEFSGIFGKYSFDKNGDIVGLQHKLKQIKGGKVVPLE